MARDVVRAQITSLTGPAPDAPDSGQQDDFPVQGPPVSEDMQVCHLFFIHESGNPCAPDRGLFPEKMDESRLDAAIALYMRCAGYTMREVANELFRLSPRRPHGQSRDERISYGHRAVWYALGTAGDIDIANIQPTEEQIQKLNHETKLTDDETKKAASRKSMKLRQHTDFVSY